MSIKKLLLTLILIAISSTAWAMDNDFLDMEGHTYKIKNKANGLYLSSNISEIDKHSIFMETDAHDDQKNYQLWYFEKAEELYKIKSKASGNFINSAFTTTTDSVFLSVDAQDEQENNQLWYLEKNREFYKI